MVGTVEKIILSFGVAWAYKTALTAPHPPPPDSELARPATVFERRWYIQYFPKINIALTALISILEITTLLAIIPNSPLRSLLPYVTLPGAHPAHLHLTSTSLLGGVIMLIAALLRQWCFITLGTFFRFEASIQKNHQLITSGPYSIVRHPSYTGMVLSHTGWLLWHLSPGSWVRECGLWESGLWGRELVLFHAFFGMVLPLYLLLSRMRTEDEALKKEFGKGWEEYARRVPYSLIPGLI